MITTNTFVFDKEQDFEEAFVRALTERGWDCNILMYKTEEELIQNWADILFKNNQHIDRLGKYPLTEGEMNQILNQISQLRTPFALTSFINGMTVQIKRDNPDDVLHLGKVVSLHIYDRQEIAGGRSCYQIVRQPEFKAHKDLFKHRRGDVMLLINGMPLFHIELKKTGVPISQAWNQIEKYSKEGIFSGLFSLIQVFVAMTPDDAVYFTNPGPDGKFNPNFYFRWADAENEPIRNYLDFTQRFLSIPMAHTMIGFYIVADGKDGVLKILRSYQYYAVTAIANKVSKNDWESNNQRGGYIWHTTGSGKTLTSFKAADHISKTKDADKVIFLVDRKELDTQTLLSFQNFADHKDYVKSVENTRVLIEKLKSTNVSDALVVTTIQKMCRVYEEDDVKSIKKDIELINKKRLVFIVDECHRDTFGDMMSKIKETFPHSLFFGFSGTPIQEENMKKGCTSADVFGEELHRYTIRDGIRDKNVLPFDLYLVSTFDEHEIRMRVALEKFHIRSERELDSYPERKDAFYTYISNLPMATEKDGLGNIRKGAEDYLLSSQYQTKEHVDAVVKSIQGRFYTLSHGKKFHAIFATSSIPEAINYYREFKKHTDLRITTLVDPSDNNTNSSYEKMEGLAEVINDYNEQYEFHFDLSTYGEMKKDISLRLSHAGPYKAIDNKPEKKLDLLIVVDQMLTGFDSKWINVLYLDKMLKQENLIQAFSRTNRLFGNDKPFGIIYYYRRPYTMDKNIEEAVKLYSGDKPFGVFVEKLKENLIKMNSLFFQIQNVFTSGGVNNFSVLPENISARAKFALLFKDFSRILEMIKVQDFKWSQSIYENIEVALTEEIYLTLLQRYKELFSLNPPKTSEDVPYDLDSQITEINTGEINDNYINSKFDIYKRLKHDKESKEVINKALQELSNSFASLPINEQKYAKQFITDIQLGNLIPQRGKTVRDYISEYMKTAKNDKIHSFAINYGVIEERLRNMMDMQLTETNINEYGRFDNLKSEVQIEKAQESYKRLTGQELSPFKTKIRLSNDLRKFILSDGEICEVPEE